MQLTCSFQILTRGIWSCWFCGQDWEAATHRTVQLSASSYSPLSRHCNSIKIHLVKFLITQVLSFLSSSPNLLMLSMFDSLYFAPVRNSPAPSTGWFAFVICLGNRKAAVTPQKSPLATNAGEGRGEKLKHNSHSSVQAGKHRKEIYFLLCGSGLLIAKSFSYFKSGSFFVLFLSPGVFFVMQLIWWQMDGEPGAAGAS